MSHPRLRRMRRNTTRAPAASRAPGNDNAAAIPAWSELTALDNDQLQRLADAHGIEFAGGRMKAASALNKLGKAARGEQ